MLPTLAQGNTVLAQKVWLPTNPHNTTHMHIRRGYCSLQGFMLWPAECVPLRDTHILAMDRTVTAYYWFNLPPNCSNLRTIQFTTSSITEPAHNLTQCILKEAASMAQHAHPTLWCHTMHYSPASLTVRAELKDRQG